MPEPVPGAGRRLHPLSPFAGFVTFDPRFALSFAALVLSGRRVWLFALALVVMLTWRLTEWWRTSYELDEDRLVVSSGVLNRSIRIVATDRVQQIEVVRRLRHRLFGLSALRIELADAGPGDQAIELDAVSTGEAERVQGLLERGRRASPDLAVAVGEAPVAAVAPAVLLRVSTAQLAVGGLTGAPILLVPVAGFTVVDELQGLGERLDVDGLAGLALIAAVTVGLIGWAVIAAGQMIVRHAGLTLTLAPDGAEIRIVRGLLERRSSVIPRRRVQLVEVSATFIRRAFQLATIDIRTAGQLDLDGTGSLDNAVPIIATRDTTALVGVLLGDVTPPVADRRHPPSARWASVVRRTPFAAAAGALVGLLGGAVAGMAVGALAAAVVGLGAHWRQRSLGHGCRDGVLVARSGVLNRATCYLAIGKIQSVAIGQGPLQRGLGLYTVTVQLAGATNVEINDVSGVQAEQIFLDLFERRHPFDRVPTEYAY